MESCSICLDSLHDKATLPCFHSFDQKCILEWINFAPTRSCPLCKTSFSFLIYDIKSDSDYKKRYFETVKAKPTPGPGPVRVQPHRRHRRERRPDPVSASAEEALAHRRHIYANALLVKRVGSNRYSKFDEVTPEIFRTNPQKLARLIPWLRRDLQVLLDDDSVELVREYLVALLKMYDPQSQEAVDRLRPFLHDHTEHFLYELAAFARSPFDMVTYDRTAQYDVVVRSQENEPSAYQRPRHASDSRNRNILPGSSIGHTSRQDSDDHQASCVSTHLEPASSLTRSKNSPRDDADEAGSSTTSTVRRPARKMQETLRDKMRREMELYERTKGERMDGA